MRTLEASFVDPSDLKILANAVELMSSDSHLASVLDAVRTSVCDGADVVLASDSEVTPAQAAQLLNMSRPHVYKLLDAGVIASRSVGSHRRITLHELADFQAKRESAKAALAQNMAHTDSDRQELVRQLAASRKAKRS